MKILAIDLSNVVITQIHGMFYPEPIPEDVGGMICWNCVLSLQRLVQQFDPDHVVIAEEGGGKKLRKQIYPAYKEGREKNPVIGEEIKFFKEFVRAFIPVNVWREDGCEADDLIAQVVEQYAPEGHYITIASNDKDMVQLVEAFPKYVSIYNFGGGQRAKANKIEKKLSSVMMKALTGDSSDNIKSVTGKKTAIKLLTGEHKLTLDEYLDEEGKTTRSEKLPRRIVFERNFRLVSLLGEARCVPTCESFEFPEVYNFDEKILRKNLLAISNNNATEVDRCVRFWKNRANRLDVKAMARSGKGVVDWAARKKGKTQSFQAGGQEKP